MESVNELLELFMRQARQERKLWPSFGSAVADAASRWEHSNKSGIESDTVPVAELHDHD